MGALEPPHLLLILVIVLVIFGPGKLTDVGSSLGKAVREFRRATDGGDDAGPTVPQLPSLAPACPACQTTAAIGQRFCASCGTRLETT